MFHRVAAQLTLACYGIIAVCGQGLHSWVEHEHDSRPEHTAVAFVAAAEFGATADAPAVGAGEQQHGHDSEDCSICQYHSLGQWFVATAPAETTATVCEFLSIRAVASAQCPALYSPAQPRAPPVV